MYIDQQKITEELYAITQNAIKYAFTANAGSMATMVVFLKDNPVKNAMIFWIVGIISSVIALLSYYFNLITEIAREVSEENEQTIDDKKEKIEKWLNIFDAIFILTTILCLIFSFTMFILGFFKCYETF